MRVYQGYDVRNLCAGSKFAQDPKTRNAVVRSLEVLGEAAKRIPEELRAGAPSIPWKRMAGMRDKLIHEYFGVDLRIVWAVVMDDLPPLRPEIERIRTELDEMHRSQDDEDNAPR